MRLTIIAVGRLKERYLKQAEAEYKQRLSRFTQVNIIELDDEPAPEKLSDKQRETVMKREGERILKCINQKDYVVALAIEGEGVTSVEFASSLEEWVNSGGAAVTFVIGGSLGLSEEVLNRAQKKLSLSRMTFTHQLSRIILVEQLYRAFKIVNNEPYHK